MILWFTLLIRFTIYLIYTLFQPQIKNKRIIKLLIFSTISSCILTIYWISINNPSFILKINWFNTSLQEFSFSICIDHTFIIFARTALFVTWSIIEFSYYYMKKDPKKESFFKTLILFLLFMLLLTASNKLFTLFIGWEGVGIMSFVLIGWWQRRSDANSAALQAIIYKRIGDGGIILFLLISISTLNTWNLNEIIFLKNFSQIPTWCLLGIILAAAGKSAQFSLHPWLPSAMEGPTPVSALLHSSTMVVAGVFLLVRTSPLLKKSPLLLTTIIFLGSLTALFAARAALKQFDIKKVVAYSTTRQLGLMVFCVGLKLPWLALYHICTHAFFKALLFLCSGRIIHSLKKEQDLRKMGKYGPSGPITSTALIIGSLRLCGTPFLAGYYSKDLILEAAQQRTTKRIGILLALIATLMTALYSIRTILFLFLIKKKGKEINPVREERQNQIFPLLRLVFGVFLGGWFFALSYFPPLPLLIPPSLKVLPLIFSASAAALFITWKTLAFSKNNALTSPTFFSARKWYFVQLLHPSAFLQVASKRIRGVLRTLDQGWTAALGPVGATFSAIKVSQIILKAQRGFTLNYFTYAFLLRTILLISLFLLF